jgi:hypothetical protein
VYVRDYLQGLQSQQKPLADAQESDESSAQTRLRESPRPEERYYHRNKAVVEASPARLTPNLTQACSVPQTLKSRTNIPLGFLENNIDLTKTFAGESGGFSRKSRFSSQPYPLSCSFFASPPQVNAFCPGDDNLSRPPNLPSTHFQQRKVDRGWESPDLRERLTGSRPTGDLVKDQHSPHRQVLSLSPPVRKFERISSPAAQVGSKFRRLSPLRESNGNSLHHYDTEQLGIGKWPLVLRSKRSLYTRIVVQKTRKQAITALQSLPQSDSICQPLIRKSSLKSLLTKSSFAEDYTLGTTFLGRFRTASTPDLHTSQSSGPLYQIQPLPRSASLTSLKHLPPDKKRSLYIGIKDHKLFIPSNSDHSLKRLVVTYRSPRREERKMPAMTPSAIFGPSELCCNCALSHAVELPPNSQFDLIDTCLGPVRRSSSVNATAGSEDSAPGQMSAMSQPGQSEGPTTLENADTPPVTAGSSARSYSSSDEDEVGSPLLLWSCQAASNACEFSLITFKN